jgi:hypothetical protein
MAFDCSNCRSHLGCKPGIWSLLTGAATVLAGGHGPMPPFLTRIITQRTSTRRGVSCPIADGKPGMLCLVLMPKVLSEALS